MEKKRVGPYRLIDLLGAGGMGDVFRAYDERLKRWVAVKQVRVDEDDPQGDKRFRREAQATAVLNHPTIVRVHDVLRTQEGEWIVMEYVEGETLASLLRHGPLSLDHGLALARQIVDGLAEAHSHGIIHRDLKTENVMVTPSGTVKILDFGLAKRFRVEGYDATDPDTWQSLAGRIVGTSRAMSPEQAQGLEVDSRSDLFSLGTLFYEIFTGVSPFKGASHIDTLNRVCTHVPASPREINAALPRQLSDLIVELLAKKPGDRPRGADEVMTTLEAIQDREDITDTVPLAEMIQAGAASPAEPTRPGRPLPPGGLEPESKLTWRRLPAVLMELLDALPSRLSAGGRRR